MRKGYVESTKGSHNSQFLSPKIDTLQIIFFICVITRNVQKNHSTKKTVKRIKETNLKTRKNHL